MTLRTISPSPSADAPLLVTYEEAGRLLGGRCVRTIERMVKEGELRSVGSGRRRGIVYQSILDYIARGGRK